MVGATALLKIATAAIKSEMDNMGVCKAGFLYAIYPKRDMNTTVHAPLMVEVIEKISSPPISCAAMDSKVEADVDWVTRITDATNTAIKLIIFLPFGAF
jgi:hypothetical protein